MKATIWVCAHCGTPIEPKFPQDYGDTIEVRCPGDDPECSPLKGRYLLHEGQVKSMQIDLPSVADV